MWVYTFFPDEAGILPHKCCPDGRGRKVTGHGRRDAAESLVLRAGPPQVTGRGVQEPLLTPRGGDRRWLMLLGRSRAVASVRCQTHRESLCQKMTTENGGVGDSPQGVAVGLLFCLQIWGGFCFPHLGFFSALAPASLLWVCSLHLPCQVNACLALSFLRSLLCSGRLYTETLLVYFLLRSCLCMWGKEDV